LVLLKCLVSALVLAGGFRAISDDDYARIVIAQRFAELPTLDPSGTSWLPLPFWLYGTVLRVFGQSIDVARTLAVVLGVLGTLLIYVAARWFGASRNVALVATALSTTISYAAWLGVATVPDGPTAALLLFAAAALNQSSWQRRSLGALGVGAACWCRYEAWPVALVFGLFTLYDARRARSPGLLIAALIAWFPAASWLLHGALHHDSAWFFFKRVSDYRRALGGSTTPWLLRLVDLPLRLVRFEPQLALLFGAAIWLAFRTHLRAEVARYSRAAVALSALLVFLIAGELSDGAPTHHSERTLLSIWFLMCLVSADLLLQARQQLTPPTRKRIALSLGAAICVTLLLRPRIAQHGTFAERAHELDIGKRARSLGVERLGVLCDDYGYFAIIAAYASPSQAVTLNEHDPRHAHGAKTQFAAADYVTSLAARKIRAVIVPHEKSGAIPEHALVRESNAKFALLELQN
jgi:hypothetical protein